MIVTIRGENARRRLRKWSNSLRLRVLLALILSVSAVSVIATIINLVHIGDEREADLKQRAQTLASVMADSLARPLFDFNGAAVQSAVRALGSERDVIGVLVTDDSGALVAITGNVSGKTPSEGITATRHIIYREVGKHTPVGQVTIFLSRKSLDQFMVDRIHQGIVELLGLGTVLAIVVTIIFRRISEPLGRITDALERLSTGDTSHELIGLHRSDEIGRMAEAVQAFREAIIVRKKVEERLRYDALHDSLTGLPNRTLFYDRLQQAELRRQRSPARHYAVLYLDLDRFKTINDSLGHTLGDRLIIEVSARLNALVRSHDTVARLSGDEFLILLEEISTNEIIQRRAENLREALRQGFNLEGRSIFLTASLGVAPFREGLEHVKDLVRDADLALHQAKGGGRDRIVLFDPSMHVRALKEMEIGNDLRRALGAGEIITYFQPIMDLAENHLAGFEALVRWRHRERGLIPPLDFIPLAEDTGLIKPIGLLVLECALSQLKRWRNAHPQHPPFYVTVNLSPVQLADRNHVATLLSVVRDMNLTVDKLKFEITESVIMQQPDQASDLLHEIRDAGVGLAIDDFGTGYSSFSYLHSMPFDTLKIDRSFVKRLNEGERHQRIVRAIIGLAVDLDMHVVAEGVEEANIALILAQMGCHYAQGYLFSAPVPAEKCDHFFVLK